MKLKDVLTVPEAAEKYNVSQQWLSYLLRDQNGELVNPEASSLMKQGEIRLSKRTDAKRGVWLITDHAARKLLKR